MVLTSHRWAWGTEQSGTDRKCPEHKVAQSCRLRVPGRGSPEPSAVGPGLVGAHVTGLPQHGGVRGTLHTPGHHGEWAVPLPGQCAAPQGQVSGARPQGLGVGRSGWRRRWAWRGDQVGPVWVLTREQARIKTVLERGQGWTEMGRTPGSGRSPGEENDYPFQYSCQDNPMDRGAWWATVHGITKSWT